MGWDYIYLEKEKIIQVVIKGEYKARNIDDCRKGLQAKARELSTKKVIVDYRQTDYHVDIFNISKTPDYLLKNEMVKDYYYAVILNPDNETHKRLKLCFSNIDVKNFLYGYNIRYKKFESVEESIAWLNKENIKD